MKQGGIMKMAQNPLFTERDKIRDQYSDIIPQTSLRENAPHFTDEEKIVAITGYFREIMLTLGLDLKDDNLKETPKRVARMFVEEISSGLNPKNKPIITLFDNNYKYNQMLVEKDICLYSNCEHHFVPIIGKAHVAYISTDKIIGLSKINRIVKYYSQRPQVQERLTLQIANELKSALQTKDVPVLIEASHLCVSSREIKDRNSSTVTPQYSGAFLQAERRDEFLRYINSNFIK